MTAEARKKLQDVLKKSLCDAALDKADPNETKLKNIYLLFVSLIYELNSKESSNGNNSGEFPCFCHRIHEMLTNLSTMKTQDTLCFEYFQQFTNLAHNLGHLSSEIDRLLVLLNREYSNRIFNTVHKNLIKQ